MRTEEQAREKWCPWARVVEMLDGGESVEGFPVGNRSTMHDSHPYAHCIASDCMAWRWEWDDRKDSEPNGGHSTHGDCGYKRVGAPQ